MPKDWETWTEALTRPGRWVDGPCLVVAASRLQRRIVVWRWDHDEWQRMPTIEPLITDTKALNAAREAEPLVLRLRDKHYTVLQPQLLEGGILKAWPADWSEPVDKCKTRWKPGSERAGVEDWLPGSPSSAAASKWLPGTPLTSTSKNSTCQSWLPRSTASTMRMTAKPITNGTAKSTVMPASTMRGTVATPSVLKAPPKRPPLKQTSKAIAAGCQVSFAPVEEEQ